MPQPIPTTSASRLLDEVCARTGIPRLVITRALYTTVISGFTIKKVIIPIIKKYQKSYRPGFDNPANAHEQRPEISNTDNAEGEDDAVLAATHLTSGNRRGGDTSSAAVDKVFFLRLYRLLKIMFPGVWTVEAGLLGAHSITLIARTVLSIHVALLEGTFILTSKGLVATF